MKVCFDAFALLAWLRAEPSAPVVRRMLARATKDPTTKLYLSEVNLGEVYYRLARLQGLTRADAFWWEVLSGALPLSPVEVTTPRVRAAARIKAVHPVSYADAFACATALEHGAPLVTGDAEIIAVREALGLEVVDLTTST